MIYPFSSNFITNGEDKRVQALLSFSLCLFIFGKLHYTIGIECTEGNELWNLFIKVKQKMSIV